MRMRARCLLYSLVQIFDEVVVLEGHDLGFERDGDSHQGVLIHWERDKQDVIMAFDHGLELDLGFSIHFHDANVDYYYQCAGI